METVRVGAYREADHVAPVAGVMTVFATVEFPTDEPPERIEIAGNAYARERTAARVRRDYGDGIGHHECGLCGCHVGTGDAHCRMCGATLEDQAR